MSKSKPPQHNSKPISKKTYLPLFQKKVLLYLANNEPKNINETMKALKSHYKSTWDAFNNLEKKTLIKPVSTKNYQGQEYPRFWVTDNGALLALCEGAEAKGIIKKTLEIYPDKKILHYLLESVSILGTEAFDYGYFAFVSKGKLEQNDIAKMIMIQSSLSPEKIVKFSELLVKYPEEKQKFDKLATEITDKVNNLINVFNQSKAKDDEDKKDHSKSV